MRCPILIALTLAAALLPGAGCNLVVNERSTEAPIVEAPGRVPYAAFERRKVQGLREELHVLLAETLRRARVLLNQLDVDLAALTVPERFSTNDRILRTWHQSEWNEYRTTVEGIYETVIERLQLLQEQAMVYAISRAEELVGKRSPLDDGPTGDSLVDQAITSFAESMQAEASMIEVRSRAEHDALGRIELVQVFSTFTSPGADEVLGGRLILFLGGDADIAAPHVKLVLKSADDRAPRGVRVLQAVRYRVYRGHTIVQDLGWRPMPRGPVVSIHDSALVIDNIEPRLDTEAEAFMELAGMRVVSDMQTVIVNDGDVRGGVNWRVEFRITARGDVSWQHSGVPQFSPICAEAVGAFQ